MSPSSLSRALGSVETDLLREQALWLLSGFAGLDELLRHPAMQTYDATGKGWHVFDYDPTVTTLRHRALPTGGDLPEPRRRSEDTGAPGYSGRKRGDIPCRRCTTQHAGSSVWIHAHMSPGNGDTLADLERSLDSIVQTCERLEHPLSAARVRMDGEHGNVPCYLACRERGVPFITRLNRMKLLGDDEVLAALRSARGSRVADSGSGPRRAAADLSVMTIAPGKRALRDDGSSYESVTVRVVASIFPNSGKAGRGRIIDGWQVELFAADVPAHAWPAPEVVTAYYGRNSEENRFAQEDRELGLDRIIRYHLPGQDLATLVGLSVWNLRVVQGFGLDSPRAERPVERLRQAIDDDRVPPTWPRDPVLLERLAELDGERILARRPGWTWDATTGEVVCPDGRALKLTTVRRASHARGRTGIIFVRPTGGCAECSSREGCRGGVLWDVPLEAGGTSSPDRGRGGRERPGRRSAPVEEREQGQEALHRASDLEGDAASSRLAAHPLLPPRRPTRDRVSEGHASWALGQALLRHWRPGGRVCGRAGGRVAWEDLVPDQGGIAGGKAERPRRRLSFAWWPDLALWGRPGAQIRSYLTQRHPAFPTRHYASRERARVHSWPSAPGSVIRYLDSG